MKPHAGFMGFIDGKAVELLSLQSKVGPYEIWDARTLFVDPSKKVAVRIRSGELLRPLHTTQC